MTLHRTLGPEAHNPERKPVSADELVQLIAEADQAEAAINARATAIVAASIVMGTVAAGLLAHDSVLVSGLVFGGVALASARLLLGYWLRRGG